MALRLRVVSDHRRLLGERASFVFGVAGGSIGRSADNDWVLPDPQRYVSSRHARVHFRQGEFYIEDLSTNGTFVNDEAQPIGKHAQYRLRPGDVLRLGEYQIVVTIEADDVPVVDEPPAVPTSIHVLKGIGRAAQTDIGAQLDLGALLITEEPAESGVFGPVDAFGQAVAAAPGAASAPQLETAPVVHAAPELEDESVARRLERLAKAIAKRERNAASAPAVYDVKNGLEAFCRGAGIDSERLPADAQARLLHLAGQLLREALVGLKDLDRTHSELRNRFRIELPVDPDDPRPSLARSTIDDLLTELFSQHESRRLDAVQWLRETLGAAKLHVDASAHAMRAAFVEFIDRLDPAELETRFERTAKRGRRSETEVRAANWELYRDFYRNLSEMPADHLPHTFVEAFANAYRAKFTESSEEE